MNIHEKTYNFTVVLQPFKHEYSTLEDALFEAECDDALLGKRSGVVYLDFDRVAENFESAVLSAIKNVESAETSVKIAYVEPSDLVTAAEIARRIGNSRESVRLWIEGKRGCGDFPLPRAGISGKSVLYSWLDVCLWLKKESKIDEEECIKAAVISEVNYVLESEEPRSTRGVLDTYSFDKFRELRPR